MLECRRVGNIVTDVNIYHHTATWAMLECRRYCHWHHLITVTRQSVLHGFYFNVYFSILYSAAGGGGGIQIIGGRDAQRREGKGDQKNRNGLEQ